MEHNFKNFFYYIFRRFGKIGLVIAFTYFTLNLSGQNPSTNHPICHLDHQFSSMIPNAGVSSMLISGVDQICDDESLETFSKFNNNELTEYLINVDDYTCFGTKVFYYQPDFTEKLFENSKITAVAKEANALASKFSGSNNGLYGLLQYLSVATIRDLTDDIYISEAAWAKITEACNTLAKNSYLYYPELLADEDTEDTNFITGTLYSICWAHDIATQKSILDLTKKLLEDLDSFNLLISNSYKLQYSYYFKYDYILNTYFNLSVRRDVIEKERNNNFYQNPKFYLIFDEYPYHEILKTLGNIGLNNNIKNASFKEYQNLPNFALRALQRIGYKTGYDASETLYENYLSSIFWNVFDKSPELSAAKIISATVINFNGDQFDLSELNELKSNAKNDQFPNKHIFEDGNLIFYSSLNDTEILDLYEAIQQVKAQFFRLFELTEDMPVEGDINETLQIRIYKNRNEYIDFNNTLFNAPSYSGGVYIEDFSNINEDYATLYTWDRNVAAGESSYELEELVRHEYMHYLQGRYLVKGLWGSGNKFYDDQRLTWFEEGMAEFFTGSSANKGIIDRRVTQNSLISIPSITMNNVMLSASEPYVYAPMIWSAWYTSNRDRFKELIQFTRQGESGINGFDAYLKNSIDTDNAIYEEKINCVKNADCAIWTPNTISLPYQQTNAAELTQLVDEVNRIVNNVSSVKGEVQFYDNESRFVIEGKYTANSGANNTQDAINLYNRLDEILKELDQKSNYNNFNFATAYYSEINVSNFPPSATFHIVGPLQKVNKPCIISGCTNADALNYNPNADCDDGSCKQEPVTCRDEIFQDYPWLNEVISKINCTDKSLSVYYDGKRFYYVYIKDRNQGKLYINFDLNTYMEYGTDSGDGYLPNAYKLSETELKWSCACNDTCREETCNQDPCSDGVYVWDSDQCACKPSELTHKGCTDSNATNYNASANCEDGSCEYSMDTEYCSNFTGTFFFEDCGGTNYYFIETSDGKIYDPYFAEGVYINVYEGLKVKFEYTNYDITTPCSVSEKAILITCVEEEQNCKSNSGTIFFQNCGGESYFFLRSDDGKVFDPYFDDDVHLDVYEGQKVNFDYLPNGIVTPCAVSEQAITLTCIEEIPLIELVISDPVFNNYSWLSNYVDRNNCLDEEIKLYYDGNYYYFIYILSENEGALYFANGTLYSTDKGDHRLVDHFQLEEIGKWTCGCESANRFSISGVPMKEIKSKARAKLSENKLVFNISPNPVYDVATISLLNVSEVQQDVMLYDLTGKVLKKLTIKANNKSLKLDLSNYPSGDYLVEISNKYSSTIKKLILK